MTDSGRTCEQCEGDGSYSRLADCTTGQSDCACNGKRVTVDPCDVCGGSGVAHRWMVKPLRGASIERFEVVREDHRRPSKITTTEDAAVEFAQTLGGPVVVLNGAGKVKRVHNLSTAPADPA